MGMASSAWSARTGLGHGARMYAIREGYQGAVDGAEAGGITAEEGIEISRRLAACGMVDFLNVVKGHIDTDPGLTDVIPVQGMRNAPHLDFAGQIRKAMQLLLNAKRPYIYTGGGVVPGGVPVAVAALLTPPASTSAWVAGRPSACTASSRPISSNVSRTAAMAAWRWAAGMAGRVSTGRPSCASCASSPPPGNT